MCSKVRLPLDRPPLLHCLFLSPSELLLAHVSHPSPPHGSLLSYLSGVSGNLTVEVPLERQMLEVVCEAGPAGIFNNKASSGTGIPSSLTAVVPPRLSSFPPPKPRLSCPQVFEILRISPKKNATLLLEVVRKHNISVQVVNQGRVILNRLTAPPHMQRIGLRAQQQQQQQQDGAGQVRSPSPLLMQPPRIRVQGGEGSVPPSPAAGRATTPTELGGAPMVQGDSSGQQQQPAFLANGIRSKSLVSPTPSLLSFPLSSAWLQPFPPPPNPHSSSAFALTD
jgi:hypothetical protein